MTDDPDRTCAVGLDVGGTKIAAGLVTLAGRVLARRTLPTRPERGGKSVLDDALKISRGLLEEADASEREVLGIGVGVAELVDPDGNVTSSHTIDWRGLPVRESFSRMAPAAIDSDVRAAALAEAIYGAGRRFDPFLYVTVGTGISCCLVQDGRPYAGARGNALVLSGAPADGADDAGTATPLSPRLLEDFAAGPALVRRYNRRRGSRGAGRAEDVVAAAEAGDPAAAEVVESAGTTLGAGVGWLVNALDPEAVVVGGGLGLAGGLYRACLISAARDHVWAEAGRDLPILPAALHADAGLVGAAATFLRGIAGERS